MKKLLLSLSVLLAGSSLIFTGCKKDDDDTTGPDITIDGANPYFVNLGLSFTDPGATAFDDVDGGLTPTATGTVNTNAKGTYTITYTAEDEAGNITTDTRTVYVMDITGVYNCTDVTGGNTTNFTDTVALADAAGRVVIKRIGNYVNGNAYFNLSDDENFDLPSQNVTCGNPAALRNFDGTSGSVGTLGGKTQFQFSFVETTNGTSVNSTDTYTKQ